MVVTVIKNSLPLQTKNTIWLGWRDSNPRMTGPEPVALPLGDTPSLQNTVAQAGVVFKLFASKLLGFIVLHTYPLFRGSLEEMVACRQANKFSDFVREMNNSIETFILSLY